MKGTENGKWQWWKTHHDLQKQKGSWAVGGQQMLSILEEPLFNTTNEWNQNPHSGKRHQFFCLGRGNGWREVNVEERSLCTLGSKVGYATQSVYYTQAFPVITQMIHARFWGHWILTNVCVTQVDVLNVTSSTPARDVASP